MSNGVEFEPASEINSVPSQSDSPVIKWIMKSFSGFIKTEKQAYMAVVVILVAALGATIFFTFRDGAKPYQPSREEMFRLTPPVAVPLQ